jgi:hypothetical protein
LNFIVEGCVFRDDIEIPTPPSSNFEPDVSRAPWEREDLPELDYDGYQAQWERDEVNGSNRKLADEPRYREPSPPPVRFIPSAAFTRSRGEELSNTPPDEFDRYIAESFRPVTKPLLPATTTPARDVAAPKAATTGAAINSRAGPSGDIAPRRLSYSDVSVIRRSHGERDPNLGAGDDDDYRFDDDPDLDPDDWQDQALYDGMLCDVAATSPSSSPDGYRSDSSSSPEGFRFDEPQFDSDGRSIASTCSSPSRYPDSDMDDYCGDAGDQYDYG